MDSEIERVYQRIDERSANGSVEGVRPAVERFLKTLQDSPPSELRSSFLPPDWAYPGPNLPAAVSLSISSRNPRHVSSARGTWKNPFHFPPFKLSATDPSRWR